MAILLATDTVLIPVCLVVAFALQGVPQALTESGAWSSWLFLMLVVFGILVSISLGIAGTRLRDYEGSATALTAGYAVLVTGAAAMIFGTLIPTGTYVVFGMAFFMASFLSRIFMREVLIALYRSAEAAVPVIIYGAGTTGLQIAAALRRDDTITPVAFVDDNAALHGKTVTGLRVYSPLKLVEVAARHSARRVILAMPTLSVPKRVEIARRLRDTGLDVQAVPSFAQLVGEDVSVDQLLPVDPRDLLQREHLSYDQGRLTDSYTGRSVLVSGAGGSIGSELSRQVLACKPRRLVLFELSEHALFQVERDLQPIVEDTGIEIVPILGSVTDPRLVRSVIRDHEVEVILHAAAYKHVPLVESNVISGLANNVLGTHTLAREALAAGVERFILISSDKAIKPTSVMGATKRLAELIVQDLAARSNVTRFAAVRFGNVLGSSGSVIPVFREQISVGGPVTLTDENATRYFMTVEEAVRLVLVAGAYAAGREIFVLDMGEPLRIRDLARKMIAAAGYTVRDAETPEGDIEIKVIGLREGERVHEERMTNDAVPSGAHPAILKVEAPALSEIELAGLIRAIRGAVTSGGNAEAREIIERFVSDYRQLPPAPAKPAAQR